MFVDITKYLEDRLKDVSGKEYVISKERQLDADDFEGQIVAIQLSGNIYDESASIPYRFEIVTKDPEKVQEDFTKLALANNNKPFTSVVETDEENFESFTVIPYFNTPVVINGDARFGNNNYAKLVCFATFSVLYQISEVKSIKIDSEPVSFQNATLSYNAEVNSNRVSGVELNKAKKRVATCALSFSLIHKATVFTNKCFQIMTGQLKGNTSFSVEIEMTNGLKATLVMFIGIGTLTSARALLPSEQVTLYVYDDRGEVNNA